MGLGSLAPKNTSTSPQGTTQQGEASGSGAAASKAPTRAGWTRFLGADAGAQDKDGQDNASDDDKKIRFTIGGEGKRMTKEDFISEVQKLDAGTRKQVVDQSSASQRVKTIANQEPASAVPRILEQRPSTEERTSSKDAPIPHDSQPSEQTGETEAERRRRLAVLSTQGDEEEEEETPAERRRREAALGVSGDGAESDDEDRAASGMRIRFAEPERGRR